MSPSMVDGFMKRAEEALKPYSVSEAGKLRPTTQRYAQPQGSSASTRPDLVVSQQNLPPPAVM